jgi:hypothetical protein
MLKVRQIFCRDIFSMFINSPSEMNSVRNRIEEDQH